MSAPDDLPERLDDLARAAGPWADPLPAVRRRVLEQRRERPRRHWRPSFEVVSGLAAVAAVVLVVVGVVRLAPDGPDSSAGSSNAIGGTAVSSPKDAPSPSGAEVCRMPAAAGSLTGSVRISVTATDPLTMGVARPGIRVRIVSTTERPITLRATPAQLLLLRDGRVVGRSAAPGTGPVPLAVSAAARTVPGPGALRGCGGGPLRAGTYRAVAVVAYRTASGSGVLVSPSVPVRLR